MREPQAQPRAARTTLHPTRNQQAPTSLTHNLALHAQLCARPATRSSAHTTSSLKRYPQLRTHYAEPRIRRVHGLCNELRVRDLRRRLPGRWSRACSHSAERGIAGAAAHTTPRLTHYAQLRTPYARSRIRRVHGLCVKLKVPVRERRRMRGAALPAGSDGVSGGRRGAHRRRRRASRPCRRRARADSP